MTSKFPSRKGRFESLSDLAMRPDRLQATSKTLSRIAGEPMTWLPLLPVAAAYAFIGVPWWICLAGGAAVGSGIVAWWKRRWSMLYEQARVENLRAYVTRENTEAEAAIQHFAGQLDWRWLAQLQKAEKDHEPLDAHTLLACISQKRMIEAKILDDGILTDDEEDLSRVVSKLVSGIREELERLSAPALTRDAGREHAARKSLRSIAAACRTLSETNESAEQIIDPLAGLGEPLLGGDERGLDRSVAQLRERMHQAASIKRRVAESLGHADHEWEQPDGSASAAESE